MASTPTRLPRPRTVVMVVAMLAFALIGAACSSDPTAESAAVGVDSSSDGAGIRPVSPTAAAELLADPPADLVVLDVRTAEEFAEGHLAEATMLDFYQADFADRLAELPRDVPYVLYCRSGNRSGQTRLIMDELGFTDVADVQGGIVAWAEAGLPLAAP